jgi:hypothetical protein
MSSLFSQKAKSDTDDLGQLPEAFLALHLDGLRESTSEIRCLSAPAGELSSKKNRQPAGSPYKICQHVDVQCATIMQFRTRK